MTKSAISMHPPRRIWILALYVGFAIGVYVIHGPRPPISIDHIAYFKQADQIHSAYPRHDYWRAISATHSYGVIMAYFFDLTGDHVKTLKILLAIMTLAYLVCAEFLFSRFTPHRWIAVLFAVVSGFHVSFGPVFWGVTDFSASLNRTMVVPPMLLLLGFYFGNYGLNRRLLVYPALVLLSVLHLGTYYLLGVLVTMDGIRILRCFCLRRDRCASDLRAYLASFALIGGAYIAIQPFNLKGDVLSALIPRIERTAIPETATSPRSANDVHLSSRDAWRMELFAQPWRNFPPPLATDIAAGMSLALVVPLSILGGMLAIRRSGWRTSDKPMLLMAGSVLFCSYGLQSALWMVRKLLPIYPLNFEEVRTVSLIYCPILYFTLRGFEWMWVDHPFAGARRLALLAVGLFLLQPIVIVRLLPLRVREHMLAVARKMGVLDQRETQRTMYARQVLRLETDGQGFYYSVLPTFKWLRAHIRPTDRILTNRDELYMLPATVIGTSNGFLNIDIRSPQRLTWHQGVLDLDAALSAHDAQRVRQLARKDGADYAVLPWSEKGAVWDDGNYSVIATK